jgi:hypothetical protein
MKLNAAGVVAVVALVALAGCTGFAPGSSPGASPTADTLETDEPTEPTDYDGDTETGEDAETDDDDESGDAGVVRFYISDEKNAISDFRHLNVTISEVGLQQAGDAESDDGEEPSETTTVDNGTEVPTEEQANSTEEDEDEESESGDWVEYDVDDRTFDLTKLQGANASLLDELETPEGSYSKVFVHVEEINATLQNGESVNVKLPSEKLQINQEFTVEANDTVDFVFDITVHKAGNSGKYILTPVISESGPDVPIEDVDDEREEESEDESEEDETDEETTDAEEDESEENESDEETADAETQLNATLVGQAEPGANATVRVSMNGSAVANATVMVDGEVVGTTDEEGLVTVPLPEDRSEVEVEIESGDADAELLIELEEDGQAPPA